MRTGIAALAGLLVVLVSCSAETSPTSVAADSSTTTIEQTTTPQPVPTTEVSPTTATTVALTTVTAITSGFVVVPPLPLTPPEPLAGSDGGSGSGCAPGSDELPDGLWFGYVLDKDESSIDFDLACFYFGEIAWEIAALEGGEANNDFWIVNESDRLRTATLAPGAVAWSIAGDTSQGHSAFDLLNEWPRPGGYTECVGEFCGVWLYINDGLVTELVEQYIP